VRWQWPCSPSSANIRTYIPITAIPSIFLLFFSIILIVRRIPPRPLIPRSHHSSPLPRSVSIHAGFLPSLSPLLLLPPLLLAQKRTVQVSRSINLMFRLEAFQQPPILL